MRRSGRLRGAALLGLLLAAPLGACRDEPRVPPAPVGTAPGNRAPPLAGEAAAGGRYQPADGGTRVVVFYESGRCGLCRVQLQRLQAGLEGYRELGAEVVAATGDSPEEARRTAALVGATFPLVSVDTAALAAWGARDAATGRRLPATFVVDGRGRVRYRHVGRTAADRGSDVAVLAVLQELRAGPDGSR